MPCGSHAAYPEYFGNSFDTESILTQAMDIARGGKFYDPPSEYPAGAWYKYSDESCNYNCQISEYFYWAVMANIGALDTSITSKCYPDKDEWNICTKSELKAKDKNPQNVKKCARPARSVFIEKLCKTLLCPNTGLIIPVERSNL